MSKIAKRPVPCPSGVEIAVKDSRLKVKGPKGVLERPIPSFLTIEINDGAARVRPVAGVGAKRLSMHMGTVRSHLANMVAGVTNGFQKVLLITGVGYRAQAKGREVQLSLGFSHPVKYKVREGVTVQTPEPTRIVVEGIDKEAVGQVAAELRRLKPPEPYKGKGIRYEKEVIRRKAGKAAGK
ncbi:MAG: 50S ribosomal protein L6 [Candidatus Hydrogenedentota bacterium]|nr:MAG: 50S ribosomal protein L6 [Candidatus Hydrogenedentota bacterium]